MDSETNDTDTESFPLLRPDPNPKSTEKLTPYLLFVCLVAAISGFNYGYHAGVLNTPKQIISNCSELNDGAEYPFMGLDLPPCFSIDGALWGTIIGMFAIGGLVGGLVAGWLADRIGRRGLIMYNNLLFILGSLLMMFAVSTEMLLVARIIIGIGAGISTVIVPMYVGEVSPSKYRGGLGVLMQLSITLGISVSQIVGLGLSTVPGWRWLVGLTTFVALLQLILMPFCVQSPRWLIMRKKEKEAKVALARLRGTGVEQIESEFDYIFHGQSTAAGGGHVTVWEILTNTNFKKPLIISILLQIIQQLSGVNAVVYYSTSIFEEINPENADILTVSVGLLNFALTILSVFLMDRAGRRILLMFGEIGMIITGALYTVSFAKEIGWLSIICTYLYMSTFAVGLGPIPFLILSEIFPTNVVATAASLAMPVNWLCNYLVGQFFPLMSDGLGSYAFLPFTGVLCAAFVFTFVYIPETKGKTLEHITNEMKGENSQKD